MLGAALLKDAQLQHLVAEPGHSGGARDQSRSLGAGGQGSGALLIDLLGGLLVGVRVDLVDEGQLVLLLGPNGALKGCRRVDLCRVGRQTAHFLAK